MIWNEKIVQSELYNLLDRPGNAMINVKGMFGWEADMLIIRERQVDEYEVKVSHSDFLADLNKNRYEILKRHWYQCQDYPERANRSGFASEIPNRFWYVCPEGIINPVEVPEYAGLLWIMPGYNYKTGQHDDQENHMLSQQLAAPDLHTLILHPTKINEVMHKAVYRMWDLTGRLGRAEAKLKEAGLGPKRGKKKQPLAIKKSTPITDK